MKSLFCCINNLVDSKLSLIYDFIDKNNVDNLYIFLTNFNKDKLIKLIDNLPKTTRYNIKLFLDSSSSYDISVNDINSFLNNNNLSILFDEFYTIKYKNINLNLVTDFIEKEDLYEYIDLDSSLYEVFLIKDKKYKFDYKIFPKTKAIFVSIPYLNNRNEIVYIERYNGIVEGSCLKINTNGFDKTILFKL